MRLHLALKSFLILTVFILANISCKKNEQFMNNAEIIGLDVKMCPWCGGMEITIDNVPIPNGNSYFLANHVPSNFIVGNNPQFPIAVKIDWTIN
ncbi:MAG TPA: hypothetical protein VET23_15390 [Chitinophagaceae bacterium]|nr:hypothetical protein [Chitinophagaceae bacterium]